MDGTVIEPTNWLDLPDELRKLIASRLRRNEKTNLARTCSTSLCLVIAAPRMRIPDETKNYRIKWRTRPTPAPATCRLINALEDRVSSSLKEVVGRVRVVARNVVVDAWGRDIHVAIEVELRELFPLVSNRNGENKFRLPVGHAPLATVHEMNMIMTMPTERLGTVILDGTSAHLSICANLQSPPCKLGCLQQAFPGTWCVDPITARVGTPFAQTVSPLRNSHLVSHAVHLDAW
jgi:hypothetical protein